MSEPISLPRLVATTREIDPTDDPLLFASSADPIAWLRRGDGLIGAGPELLRLDVGEDGRLDALADMWRAIAQATDVDDPIGLPGTGLVGFGAFAFDETSTHPSTLIVPTTVIGRRGGRAWVTTIGRAEGTVPAPQPHDYGAYWSATLGPGAMDPEAHGAAVRAALEAIRSGELSKVVVARDIAGTIPAGADLRRLVRALASGYPDTWVYAVDGIIGASPETLVTVSGGTVTARVLAGTRPRGADADEDAAITAELAASEKDNAEHDYAVQSVLRSLHPHTSALAAAEQPFMLRLPNLWHLATDVEGTLENGSTALDMVRALHPTAAVAGTPTDAAVAAIRRIEPFDRGRYAGPVGWIDGNGDGEWAIALRCAQFGPVEGDTRTVVAHAGGGIVEGSVAEAELLETRVKFRPIVDALA
ncbi:isochorismate synthase [Microbacterium sediminis]|uniref:isochorismate synthase n=1 Tax=Microbacterium sediminis TaxID=904291 RepID=A0A1B9ND79_9MICO|nr:isochorismate synthase [Microbacterium sediminis]OCG74556.1 isochorismate synthase [Microbacterium sediminis]